MFTSARHLGQFFYIFFKILNRDVFNLFAVYFITEAGSSSSPRLLDGSSTLSSFDISSADMIRLRSPCVCGSSFTL